jgi:hypothetical protein
MYLKLKILKECSSDIHKVKRTFHKYKISKSLENPQHQFLF